MLMPVKIFFCYAREDERLLNQLKIHLKSLQRQGIIEMWYDRGIDAGTEWRHEIDSHLSTSDIVLLLISPDFMNSDYCYGIEMKRAMERYESGEARVIPIILRHVYWQGEPLDKLQALPTDAKPVTDPIWHNLDMAFYNVTEGIRKVAEGLTDFHLIVTAKQHKERITSVVFGPKGRMLASSSADGLIKLWQGFTNDSVDVSLSKDWGRISSIVFSPDGETLAIGSSDAKIRLWNILSRKLTATLDNSSMIYSIAISPNGKILASGSFDKKIRIWSLQTHKLLRTLEGHASSVMSVAFSPDGEMLAGGSSDATIKIWYPHTGELAGTLFGHSKPVRSISISSDRQTIASGSDDMTVKLWRSNQLINTLVGHSDRIMSVAFSPNGEMLASGSADGILRIWA